VLRLKQQPQIQKELKKAIQAKLIGAENDRRRVVTRGEEGAAAGACDGAWRRVRTPMAAISAALESPGRDEQNRLVVGRNCNSGDGGGGGDGDDGRSDDNERRWDGGCSKLT